MELCSCNSRSLLSRSTWTDTESAAAVQEPDKTHKHRMVATALLIHVTSKAYFPSWGKCLHDVNVDKFCDSRQNPVKPMLYRPSQG